MTEELLKTLANERILNPRSYDVWHLTTSSWMTAVKAVKLILPEDLRKQVNKERCWNKCRELNGEWFRWSDGPKPLKGNTSSRSLTRKSISMHHGNMPMTVRDCSPTPTSLSVQIHARLSTTPTSQSGLSPKSTPSYTAC